MNDTIRSGKTGRCPHCGVTVLFSQGKDYGPNGVFDDVRVEREFEVVNMECPACKRPIVALEEYESNRPLSRQERILGQVTRAAVGGGASLGKRQRRHLRTHLIWPPSAARPPVPEDAPKHVREDYEDAARVLPASEKASAGLSRRCLQSLLREAAGTKSKDLADQIEEVLAVLPGHLQKELDAVRVIGNFAAHPAKSKGTGEIIDVEPGEAEWNLDVLDMLFDFYYVQPRVAAQKRAALNKKLAEAGKPPMK